MNRYHTKDRKMLPRLQENIFNRINYRPDKMSHACSVSGNMGHERLSAASFISFFGLTTTG